MGFDERKSDDNNAGSTGTGATGGTPGKRNRTEALTGIPLVDLGPLCERASAPGCTLTPEKRIHLLIALSKNTSTAFANYRDAIQDARIDVLTSTRHGWGALAEFLFYAATGPMIASVVKLVKASEWARYADDVQATLTNASRSLRKTLQSEVDGRDPGAAGKARFLQLVRAGIKPMEDALIHTAPTMLDDAGLAALTHAFSSENGEHSVDGYRAHIEDLLARYDADQIDQVGVTTAYRHGELMWIGRGKRRRLVMLEDHGLHHSAQVMGPKPRDLIEKRGTNGKPIVVDEDLADLAVAMYRERTGREPMEMDPEAAVRAGGEIARIGGELLLDVLTLGQR